MDYRRRGIPQQERRAESWTYQQLKDHMAQSCINDECGVISFDMLPSRIDLGGTPGSFAGKANLVREMTKSDPRHREHGAQILWEPGRRSFMVTGRSKIVVGDERSVVVPREVFRASHTRESLQRMQQENERHRRRRLFTRSVGVIHSHPDTTPFSPWDFVVMIADPDKKLDIVATTDGKLRALITTDTTKWWMGDNNVMLEVDRDVQVDRIQKMMFQNGSAHAKRAGLERLYRPGTPTYEMILGKAMDAVLAKIAEERKVGYYVGDSAKGLRRLRIRK